MQSALRVTTKVLPGHRVEVIMPELPEGESVEVLVVPKQPAPETLCAMLDLIDSLPPGPRSAGTWEEVDKHLQQERDAWDR